MSSSGLVAQTLTGGHFCPNCDCLVFPAPDLTCPLCDGDLLQRFVSNFLNEDDIADPDREFIEFIGVHFGMRLTISVEGLRLVEEYNPFDALPAAASAVASLPEIVIPEGFGAGDEVLCTVCMDEFVAGRNATQMPCGHFYHRDCILPWLALRNTCPVCRDALPAVDPAPGGVGGWNGADGWNVSSDAAGGSGAGGRADD
ncbi:putative transcription factor C2H2 family [Dioscorea sansibarensis]